MLTAPPYAGQKYFSRTAARPRAEKLTRFLHDLGVKNVGKRTGNSPMNGYDNYANCYYHNHRSQNPQKTHNNHNFQMINELQRRFENADNFLFVQGCKLIMPLLACLVLVGITPVNLTEAIVRGHYEGITE